MKNNGNYRYLVVQVVVFNLCLSPQFSTITLSNRWDTCPPNTSTRARYRFRLSMNIARNTATIMKWRATPSSWHGTPWMFLNISLTSKVSFGVQKLEYRATVITIICHVRPSGAFVIVKDSQAAKAQRACSSWLEPHFHNRPQSWKVCPPFKKWKLPLMGTSHWTSTNHSSQPGLNTCWREPWSSAAF